jgi:hypothetical protein
MCSWFDEAILPSIMYDLGPLFLLIIPRHDIREKLYTCHVDPIRTVSDIKLINH